MNTNTEYKYMATRVGHVAQIGVKSDYKNHYVVGVTTKKNQFSYEFKNENEAVRCYNLILSGLAPELAKKRA